MKTNNENPEQTIREHDAEEFQEFADTMNVLFCTEAYRSTNTPEYKKLLLTYDSLRAYGCTPVQLKRAISGFIHFHTDPKHWMPADFLNIMRKLIR